MTNDRTSRAVSIFKNKAESKNIVATDGIATGLVLPNYSVVNSAKVTIDNNAVDTAYIPMVLYGTDATPPTAGDFPIGTIYIQYTP